jgi:hypothetical protein
VSKLNNCNNCELVAENSPLDTDDITPLTIKNTPLVLTPVISSLNEKKNKRRYIHSEEVQDLAARKYKKSGAGLTYLDLMDAGLAISKRQAQDTLKYCLLSETLFTIGDRRPQRYYPISIRSEILKNKLANEKSTKATMVSLLSKSKRNNRSSDYMMNSENPEIITDQLRDKVLVQTLEGFVIPLLPKAPLQFHNLHFKTTITKECYRQVKLPYEKGTTGKIHIETIKDTTVNYVFYANGTVDIHVKSSNNAPELETEEDRSNLLAFFGQIRDRLVLLLKDKNEQIVPKIMGIN